MSQPEQRSGRSPQAGGTADPAALQAEIEATRAHLGQTVDELTARLDVRSRAKEQATERALRTRDLAVETYRESPPAVIGAGATLVALVVAAVVWRRKRRSSRRKR